MKRGLYAFAGASATATAAACANRLDWPMTKLSNAYFGFRRVSRAETGVVFSNVMLAVGPSVFAAKTHYISANAGPSQYAGAQCNPFFFNVAWQNDNLDEAVGKMVTEQGFKNVLLLAPNYPGGKDNLNGLQRT